MTTPLAEGDPRRIGNIALEARIGEGGSATVYLGRSPEGDRQTTPPLAAVTQPPSIGRTPAPRLEAVSEPGDHSHLPAFLLRPIRARG